MTTDRAAIGPLGLRLAAAFVAVAVAAIAVLAGLVVFASRHEVSNLVLKEHTADTRSAAAAAAAAYQAAGGWTGADLATAGAVAAQAQATLVVTDANGTVIAAPTAAMADMMARMHGVAAVQQPRGHTLTAPVVADGHTVGFARLSFPTTGLPGPAREIRDALARTAVIGTALAALVALVVAVTIARQIGRPLAALTAAARRVASGDRSARVDLSGTPGELGVLAAAFDDMAESIEHEDAVRRRLVADVAHELRTPLTILQGTTEALVDGVVPADETTLGSLHEEVLRLARLVGDIETLAAADAAGLRLQRRPVDLADIAARAADLARAAAADASLTVAVDARPAVVAGDADRLTQIATNLLANAVHFTPPDGTITVTTRSHDGAGRLEVADTGPGIPADELPHLFERFWRGAAAEQTTGSGIGLAVVAELVAAHQGTVTAANRPNGGAVFTVEIPAGAGR